MPVCPTAAQAKLELQPALQAAFPAAGNITAWVWLSQRDNECVYVSTIVASRPSDLGSALRRAARGKQGPANICAQLPR